MKRKLLNHIVIAVFLFSSILSNHILSSNSIEKKPKSWQFYTVKEHESISKIAINQLGNVYLWKEIAKLNKLSEPYVIFPGQVIKIPLKPKHKKKAVSPNIAKEPKNIEPQKKESLEKKDVLSEKSIKKNITQTKHPRIISDVGAVGLIDMPTARQFKDKTFFTGYTHQESTKTAFFGYQVLPRLETVFRYSMISGLKDRYGNPKWHNKDRSYDIKLLLKKESTYWPAIALGINDVIGTGQFASEYLVASKSLNKWDFSLGIGWGRLARRPFASNPMKIISKRFNKRGGMNSYGGQGGTVTTDQFKGENIGLFGGFSYHWNDKLTLLAEINSDTYDIEVAETHTDIKSPLSIGLSYQLTPQVQASIKWQHNDQFSLGIGTHLATDILQKKDIPDIGWSESLPRVKISNDLFDQQDWYQRFVVDAIKYGIKIQSMGYVNKDREHIALIYEANGIRLDNDALSLLIYLSYIQIPENIKKISFVKETQTYRVFTSTYSRKPGVNFINFKRDKTNYLNRIKYSPPIVNEDRTHYSLFNTYPKADIFIDLEVSALLFDPVDPFVPIAFLYIQPMIRLSKQVTFFSGLALNVWNELDNVDQQSDSKLIPVRTDVYRYNKEGASGIDSAFLTYTKQLNQNIFFASSAGILEGMYSGFGFETLYKPFNQPFGIGLSLYQVYKREYKKMFGVLKGPRAYKTQTGFISLYWASPFYNYDIVLHLGRYLAKDKGVTLEVKRSFPSGWQLGAFATKTNVSADDFGEGSFDKGFKISLPLNQILPGLVKETSTYSQILKPIQRDGGQRLQGHGNNLWDQISNNRKSWLNNTKQRAY